MPRRAFRPALLALTALAATSLGSRALAAELPAERPLHEVVDEYIDVRLAAEGIEPAPPADDASFVRRLTLDLAGRIPAVVETAAFVQSADPHKREVLVDKLVGSLEFAEHQANVFDAFISEGDGGIRGYLKTAFQENRGWDSVFRDILLARHDDPLQKEAADFLLKRVKDTDRLANDVSVVFFGINVSCAKCHDHPLVPDWTQDHFYGMKSFFNRTFENGGFIAEREYGLVNYKTVEGEARDAKLMFLTGTVLDEPETKEPDGKARKEEAERLKKLAKEKQPPPAPQYSRRAQLVETALAEGQDHFFARAIVNRVWHQLFGYGLVMPLDQMHSENPASHPELLEWLARDLKSNGYDLRRLTRGLVLSRAYARSSRWDDGERPDADMFAVAEVRPLTPEQLARSLSLATADPHEFAADLPPEESQQRIAAAANASNAGLFERPGDNFQVSAHEALLFSNGEKISSGYLNGGLVRRLEQIEDDAAAIETAFQNVLCRPPAEDEAARLGEYVGERKDRRPDALRQVVWALVTSPEFRFNH
ncbi:MAG: DUF1549 and DUF1553 domain-containing protein [Planctomycetes bacterium]|nr:DUF1549 and DUF1553 domain-containing protein [Planctomycetota bacterium]